MMEDMEDIASRRAWFVYDVCRLEACASARPIIPEQWWLRDRAFREQFTKTVERLCADDAPPTTPEKEHESWMRAYEEMGWKYGPVRDPISKTHPDMVPFNELPEKEREKDAVFLAACEFAKRFIREQKTNTQLFVNISSESFKERIDLD